MASDDVEKGWQDWAATLTQGTTVGLHDAFIAGAEWEAGREQKSLNPLDYTCPNCNAQPGKYCSVPSNTGRKQVPWVHSSREALAGEQ